MELVIDSEDLKRLKSREEKYLAYMEMLSYWGEDKTEVEALLGKIAELKGENKTLKANVEFLHSCLDDRDNSIELLKEKLNKLEDVKKLLRDIVMDLTKLEKLKKIVFKDDADLED